MIGESDLQTVPAADMPSPFACVLVPMQQGPQIAQLLVSIFSGHPALLPHHQHEPILLPAPGKPVTISCLPAAACPPTHTVSKSSLQYMQ